MEKSGAKYHPAQSLGFTDHKQVDGSGHIYTYNLIQPPILLESLHCFFKVLAILLASVRGQQISWHLLLSKVSFQFGEILKWIRVVLIFYLPCHVVWQFLPALADHLGEPNHSPATVFIIQYGVKVNPSNKLPCVITALGLS